MILVIKIVQGAKVTRGSKETNDIQTFQAGRTLEEARKLVEQSFGNYVGSNVMLAAKEEITKIEHEIEFLVSEVDEAAIDRKCREQLSEMAYKEIFDLQEELRVSVLSIIYFLVEFLKTCPPSIFLPKSFLIIPSICHGSTVCY